MSEKPEKVLGDRCSCKTAGVKCRSVTDEVRESIHKEVWAMSWPQRYVLVKSLFHRVPVGRHQGPCGATVSVTDFRSEGLEFESWLRRHMVLPWKSNFTPIFPAHPSVKRVPDHRWWWILWMSQCAAPKWQLYCNAHNHELNMLWNVKACRGSYCEVLSSLQRGYDYNPH